MRATNILSGVYAWQNLPMFNLQSLTYGQDTQASLFVNLSK